jgi:hypothetical protein
MSCWSACIEEMKLHLLVCEGNPATIRTTLYRTPKRQTQIDNPEKMAT